MRKLYLVISAPLYLSGCMMLGIGGMGGGMHGTSPASTMKGPTIIKESIANGIRITAEFPAYILGDELVYPVTLHSARDNSLISTASIALVVILDASRNQVAHSGQLDSSMGQSTVGKMKFSSDNIGNGTFVFRPSITTGGIYTFVYLLDSIGKIRMDPPIEFRQTVPLDSRKTQQSRNGDHISGMAPAVLIGAGVMAAMMIFMFR